MRGLKHLARLLFSLGLLLAWSGCSSPKTSEVDATLAAGDYDGAARMLRPYALKKTDDAKLQERWDSVRAQASQQHIAQLADLIQAGDLDAAELAVEQAIYFSPENTDYRHQLVQLHEIRRGLSEQIRLVASSMQRHDWLSARSRLEPMLPYSVTFLELVGLWEQTAQENYRLDMREGLRHLQISDYEQAEQYYRDALQLIPQDPNAEQQLTTTQNRSKAKNLTLTARDMIKEQDYVNAVKTSRQAVALHPESQYIQSVLKESLRLATETLLTQENAAYTAGDLRQSYLLLLAAQEMEPSQRKLREQIENRLGIVTKEIAAHLLVHGIKLEKSGYYGASLLYYWLAHQVRPSFEGVDLRIKEVENKAAQRTTYRLLVMPTSEGQMVAPGGGTLMAQAIMKQLQSQYPTLLKVYSLAEMAGTTLRDTGLPPDGVLSGHTETLWLNTPAPVQTTQSVHYVSGTVPALNPEVERSKAVWQAAQQALPQYQQNLANAEKEYQEAQAKLQNAQNSNNGQLNQARILAATCLMTQTLAQAALQNAQKDVEKKLNYYLSRPPYVDVPQYRDYDYVISQFTTHGTATTKIQWKDYSSNVTLGPWTLESALKFDDTVVAGFPPAGIKEDLKDTPDDPNLLQHLTETTSKKLIDPIDASITTHGTLPLSRARKERNSGNTDPELHYLVLAWYARKTLTPTQRQEIQNRIVSTTGLSITDQHLDPALLPTAPLQ